VDARNPNALSITFPTDRKIVFTRGFDAPRALVWDAWTKPEHVRRWYGCDRYTLALCEIDLRVGGGYRFVMRGPDDHTFTMSGVYREIVKPDYLVYTERFDDDPAKEALVTLTLEERGGKTTTRSTTLYRTAADVQAVLKSGMETGAALALDRLAALVGSLHASSELSAG
jgi:uncharacterized protein YndB with AHSA1/START domain